MSWSGIPLGINSSGQIVATAEGLGGGGIAVLWTDGIPNDLNALIPSNSGFSRLYMATAINDSGQITGIGMYCRSDPRCESARWDQFLLTPVKTKKK